MVIHVGRYGFLVWLMLLWPIWFVDDMIVADMVQTWCNLLKFARWHARVDDSLAWRSQIVYKSAYSRWRCMINCLFIITVYQWIFIVHQLTYMQYWYSKSVCLSVCPSVRYVPVSYENGLTYRHSFFTKRHCNILTGTPSPYPAISNQQSRETVVGTSASITVSSVTTLNSTF